MTTSLAPNSADDPLVYRPVALVDLLDRVLAKGVVVTGELTLSIADIDLVYVSLRALVASVGSVTNSLAELPPPSGELPGSMPLLDDSLNTLAGTVEAAGSDPVWALTGPAGTVTGD